MDLEAKHKPAVHYLRDMNIFGILGVIVSLALLLHFASCRTSKPVSSLKNHVVLYELERTGCLGDCPVFRMQVLTNRSVIIIPRRGLPVTETTSDTLSEAEFKSLQRSMASLQSAQLDSSYDNRVVDAPYAILRMIADEKTQTIRCRGDEPPAFASSVMALENLAIKRGWVHGSTNMTQSPKKQLIIELAEESHMPILEEKYSNYDLKFIKKISPRQSYYLFGTSANDRQSESFLNLLKEDDLVLKVQWNHQLKKRDE